MNCPMHNLIFRARGRSYRELPLRLFEFGTVYRYEKSGVVHGLTRVRGLTQDDSHIYCTKEQMAGELQHAAQLRARPAARLRPGRLLPGAVHPRRLGEVHRRRRGLGGGHRGAADGRRASSGLELVPDPGGAAFYGPKISVQATDAIGRTWQMSTIQVDFNQPERFGLEYQAADGTRQQPVMIHRALFGSIERFFGVLTEHYAGAFPAWLAPVQVVGIPIRDDHADYLHDVRRARCAAEGIRAEVDASDDRMQKKIRTAQQQKIPFMVIAGDEDVAAGTVSFRYRDGSQRNGVPIDEAVAHVDAVDRPVARAGRRRRSAGADRGRRRQRPVPGRLVTEHRRRRRRRTSDGGRRAMPDGFERLWTPHRMAYIQGEDKPGRLESRRLPVLRRSRSCRRGRPGRRPRRAGLRGAQPVPVQPRAPAGLPVPARRRLHRPRRRRRPPSWRRSPRPRCG